MRKIIQLATVAILTCGCKTTAEKVIFSSSRNGNSDIFIMDADGKNQLALTHSELEEWGPTWMGPDNITFLRQESDTILRVKLNLKTGKESFLLHPSHCTLDDKNILYFMPDQLELYSCTNDIFIHFRKTGGTENITSQFDGVAAYPAWSFDGKSVTYTSNHHGTNDIYEYKLDSKETIQLTNSKANNERGELSPNGKYLVYSSDFYEKGNQDILIKNLQTGDIKNISNNSSMDLIARFSTDGKTIYFGSNMDGNWEIYLYNLETHSQTQLTHDEGFDGDPRGK